MKNRMLKFSYQLSLVFMVVMSVGMFISNHLFGVGYMDPRFSATFLPTYFVLVPLSILAYFKYRKPLTGDKARYSLFLWLFIPLAIAACFTMGQKFAWSSAFFLPLIDAFFVGISEELVYRGVVFTNAVEEKGLIKGVFLSALIFSLLHGINVIGGLSWEAMLFQLVGTFIAGLFFALVYYYTKNIYLMIVFHSLWDYILFTDIAKQFPLIHVLYMVLHLLEIAVIAFLLWKYVKESKQSSTR